jgi:molecular chaperone DnaK (HSP70)
VSWVLAIDFGTANTTAAHAGDGAAPRLVTVGGRPSLPSVRSRRPA